MKRKGRKSPGKKTGKNKLLIIIVLGGACIGGISYLVSTYARAAYLPLPATVSDNTESGQAKEVVYPAQYSDSHITRAAVESNARFKDIALFNREDLVAAVSKSIQTDKKTLRSYLRRYPRGQRNNGRNRESGERIKTIIPHELFGDAAIF